MDLKELKEALESDEGKKLLDGIIEENTKGLKAKNDELLGSLKSEKEKRQELEAQNAEEAEARKKAEEEAALKSGDVEKITSTLKEKHQKEMDAKDAKLAEKDSQLHKVLIDEGLSSSLTKAGVAPQHLDVVKAYIKTNHKAEVGENGAVIDGKSLSEFVTEWAQGDQGKHYVAAPNNSGAGANGQNGGGKAPGENKGDMGGDKEARTAAIRNKFPDLENSKQS